MIEVDPKIEQTFADVLARSRHRAADITDRLAAHQRELEARSERIKEEGKQLTQELDRRVAERIEAAQNPWQSRESKPTVLAFGDQDEDGRPPAPAQPAMTPPPAAAYPPAPQAAPEPAPASESEASQRYLAFEVEEDEAVRRPPIPQPPARRAATTDDEDDDYSGRSWVR